MDQTDKRILNLLQQNSRISIKKLSEKLFITAPAVSQRLKNLEDEGYIDKFSTQMNLDRINMKVKAFVQLEVSPGQKKDFYPYIEKIPNVLECECITGPYSMLIKVIFEDTKQLDDFINDIHQFGKTNTQIVFSTPVQQRGYRFNVDDK